jgi:hypothetical protein
MLQHLWLLYREERLKTQENNNNSIHGTMVEIKYIWIQVNEIQWRLDHNLGLILTYQKVFLEYRLKNLNNKDWCSQLTRLKQGKATKLENQIKEKGKTIIRSFHKATIYHRLCNRWDHRCRFQILQLVLVQHLVVKELSKSQDKSKNR